MISPLKTCYAAPQQTEYAQYFLNANEHLKNSHYDSAIAYFKSAYESGMSKDSLCYYVAESYLKKGALDTALAFNYSIKGDNDKIHNKKFEQRYLLFSLLEMKQEANETLDSMKWVAHIFNKNNYLIPEYLRISNMGGFFKEKRFEARNYPFKSKDSCYLAKGPEFHVNGVSSWNIPWPKKDVFSIALNGSIFRNDTSYNVEYDLLPFKYGFTFVINQLIPELTFNYNFDRYRDIFKTYTNSNSISLSWFKSDQRSNQISAITIMGNLESRAKSIQSYLLYTLFFKEFNRSFYKFNTSLNSYYYHPLQRNAIEVKTPIHKIFVSDLNNQYASHYSIDTSGNYKLITINEDDRQNPYLRLQNAFFRNKSDTANKTNIIVYSDTNILVSYSPIITATLFVSPSLGFSMNLPYNFQFKLNAEYQFLYYFEKYRWLSIDLPKPEEYYLAYEINSSQYYLDTSKTTRISFEEVFFPFPTQMEEKRRLDHTISISTTISKQVFSICNLSVSGTYEKHLSNLRKELPLELTDHTWRINLDFSIYIQKKNNYL
jgi:hypothetical protein